MNTLFRGGKSMIFKSKKCFYRQDLLEWQLCRYCFTLGPIFRVFASHVEQFSLCRQTAPLRSIRFHTADFPIFLARIIVIFWTTCIARKVFFSVEVMGNGKHVLPVLHCLKRGIAFVSSFIFCFLWFLYFMIFMFSYIKLKIV